MNGCIFFNFKFLRQIDPAYCTTSKNLFSSYDLWVLYLWKKAWKLQLNQIIADHNGSVAEAAFIFLSQLVSTVQYINSNTSSNSTDRPDLNLDKKSAAALQGHLAELQAEITQLHGQVQAQVAEGQYSRRRIELEGRRRCLGGKTCGIPCRASCFASSDLEK